MRKIKTKKDIEDIYIEGCISESFYKYLIDYFQSLVDNLSDDKTEEEFSLEAHGYIILLEESDNVFDLESVGLNPQDGGLVGTSPEFVNIIYLDGDVRYYQVGILYDNEYMMLFYSPVGAFGQEVESWLREYVEYNI